MNSQQASAKYWKDRNSKMQAQSINQKHEHIKACEYLEKLGFELYEDRPHERITVYIKPYTGNAYIFKSVRSGEIFDGNLLKNG